MSELILIKNKELTNLQLDIICDIKQIAWKYSIEEHKEWIKKNISENDIHVLLIEDKNFVAYLNMIQIEFFIDNIKFNGLGIGNVCSSVEKKGFGSKLIKEVNSYLKTNNKIGLLLCKEKLIKFYSSNQWLLINKVNIKSSSITKETQVMAFNLNQEFNFLKYKGFLF